MLMEAGDYKLFFTAANGNTFMLVKNLEEAGTLRIAVGDLNESMVYEFTITKPDGKPSELNGCAVFKLTTIINTQINGCDDACSDTVSAGPYS